MITYVLACPECRHLTAVPSLVTFPLDFYKCGDCGRGLLWDVTMKESRYPISPALDCESGPGRSRPARSGRGDAGPSGAR